MQVEVNEANIDLFGLDVLTGNTKQQLLDRAHEAKQAGHILSCEVPETMANVFDRHDSEVVDRDAMEHGRKNPIEDSQAEGAATQEEFHSCEFPTDFIAGQEYTCRWCRRQYYAEPDADAPFGGARWIIKAEILD